MEEAGDSADFDTQRRLQPSSRPWRPQRALLPSKARSPGPDQPADSGDRNDRDGRDDRGRGRGRRDRGGNRDRQPMADPLVASARATIRFNAPVADSLSAQSSTEGIPSEPQNVEEIGEGAPGADGSRRWRGRRGRRRGRGPGQRDESAADRRRANSETPATETSYGDDSFEVDGAAAPTLNTSTAAPVAARLFSDRGDKCSQRKQKREPRPQRSRRSKRPRRPRSQRS